MIKLFSKFPAQGWSASGGKTLFSLCVLFSFVFLVFNFNKNDKIQYVEAALISCKGPADVMLVIDRSGTMGNSSKFLKTKAESTNFVDKLFSAIPEGGPEGFNYHQMGLVAFNQLTATVNLNQNGNEIKNNINDPTGILGVDYPVGSRSTDTAIQQARLKLGTENGGNPFATKTMIILTDGAPNNLDTAKTQAVLAKNNDIRIISIGLELDAIEDGTIEDAKEFLVYAASSPADCYYIYNSGDELENCTSISLSELGATLDGIYDSITAAVCNESPPTISISRKPSGTLYADIDKLTITSNAIDDIGFKSHEIIWSDNWPNNLQTVECANLLGTTVSCGTEECTEISCDTGELGTFSAGKTITYRSAAVDANDNGINIDPPEIVTAASVSLTVPALFRRNRDNNIEMVISNHGGGDDLFISIDTPALEGIEIDKASITNCSDSGNTRTCNYNFNPNCGWTDGITNGVANDISVNIYVYAENANMGIRQIASSENNSLASYFEGKDWSGTCSDGKNNDCNYDISNNPIIDLEEMLCDITGPIIGVSRSPSDTIYDFESDETTPMPVTINSLATDDLTHNNGIKQHTIYYREDGGAWQTAFDCNDADVDGLCDEDTSQSIATISISIGSFAAGTIVDYYSEAIDYSGNDNSIASATGSFVVRNRSCFGKADLDDCVGVPGGKCCGEVCNATISNPHNYNTNCAQEICGDALLYEEDVRVAGKYGRAINFDGINDYITIPTIDPVTDPNVSASVNPTNSITVSAWVKSATDTGYSGYWQVVSKYSAYLLGTSGSGSKQMCFIVYSGGWKYGNCYTVPDPQEWHHFAGTYDRSTGEKKLYVDGILQGTPVSFVGNINPDTGPIHIGKAECCGSYFKGIIDEVYIYGRALDLGEIENLRDGLFGSADLAGYWSLNEEFGTVAYDNSGSGNYGTLIGFPVPIVKPGILWQLDADESKNGITFCSNDGSSNGCYSLNNGGCEDRGYLCSSGYCNYSSNKSKDHCDYDTGVLYDYGCSGGSCNLISSEVDPACDLAFDSLLLNAYDNTYDSMDESASFISGSSGTAVGAVLDNMTNTISLKAVANDTNGISEQKIYWKKEGDAGFTEKNDCAVPCGAGIDCLCEESIGPFVIGDVIQFYATAKDDSPNQTEETTITYSFEVFDNQCYDIDNNKNKDDSTLCEAGAGKCCGGICNTSEIENPFSYHEDCRVEACEATALFYDLGNNGNSCPSGATETCFDYYTGCVGGNKCVSGYCSPDTDGISLDSCSGNIFTDNGCSGGVCGLISTGTDCSIAGVYDGDAIACNCDCNNYDIEEKVYSSLKFDGVDDYVEIPDDSSLNISDEISVEVWVKDAVGTGSSQGDGVINDNDFVSKIRATIGTGENDGDYDKLSTWEAAIESDLTLSSSKVFSVSDRGNYDLAQDDGQTVTFDGGGTGTLKHLNVSSKVYIINVSGIVNIGTVLVDSTGHTFTISDTGQQIGRAIAECYNDWSEGLDDSVGIAGWTTDNDNYVRIYAPISERHNGRVKESGNYTGFVLVGSGTKIGISVKYTEIDGIILDSTVNYNMGIGTSYSNGNFVKISNCIFQNFGVPDSSYRGLTIGDYMQSYIYNNIFIKSYVLVSNTALSSNYVWVYNNTFYNCQLNGGNDNRTIAKNNLVYYSGACYQGNYEASSSNNISIDATAPGANSLVNKTLGEIAFVDTTVSAEDLHIQLSSCARNVGVNLSSNISSDIDRSNYLSSWDIGADEYPEGIIISKGIGKKAYSLTIDGDGNIYGNINNQSVSAQISDNNWHQAVMTYNGNSQKIYLDGVEIESKSLVDAININADDLIIGKGSAGMIDDARVYNRALYPEEITDHYNGIFADDTGLIAYWDFDKGTGITADDTSVNNNNGTLKNGPEWMKHYHGSPVGNSGNVPILWQACTDGKDNDCDGTYDEYTGIISDCDGEVLGVSAEASAKDRNGVLSGNLVATDSNITIYDSDIRETANEFMIEAAATDDFSIVQLIIEWTIDDWVNTKNETCNNAGSCEVCVEGGSCEAGRDKILSSSLLAGNVFKFKVCATDGSANNNQKCTTEYSIEIENSNAVPAITPLTVIDPDFCSERLKYILKWEFSDDGDAQDNFEIQVKENDFESPGDIIINKTFGPDIQDLFYQINSDDFETGESIEYGEKEYYWRVKVTDDRGGGYEQTTEWEVGPAFITPLYEYPKVDFIVTPDYSNPCLYETYYVGAVETCDWGENIIFSLAPSSIFVECTSSGNEQCLTTVFAKCDTANKVCVSCVNDSECTKFDTGGVTYSCLAGVCEISGSCTTDNDCLAADTAKCDIGLCVTCDDDSQCEKFNAGNISSGLLGNVSSSSSNTLTDSSKSWLNEEWAGGAVKIVSGTGSDQIRSIVSNTDKEITVDSSWTVLPDSSSEYRIIKYFCNNEGLCENKEHRKWWFYDSITYPDSRDPNPINNYIESEVNNHDVTFEISDITNNSCRKVKNIRLGGREYPKWNEVAPHN